MLSLNRGRRAGQRACLHIGYQNVRGLDEMHLFESFFFNLEISQCKFWNRIIFVVSDMPIGSLLININFYSSRNDGNTLFRTKNKSNTQKTQQSARNPRKHKKYSSTEEHIKTCLQKQFVMSKVKV